MIFDLILNFDSELLQVFVMSLVLFDSLLNNLGAFLTKLLYPFLIQFGVWLRNFLL
jgi:hypothetical protein